MEILQQAYPDVLDSFLKSALDDVDGDVIDALDSLRLSLGTPSGPGGRSSDSDSLSCNKILLEDDSHYRTRRWLNEPKIETIQPGSSKEDDSPLRTWITIRALFPEVTFDYIRRQYDEWEGPRPDNFTQIIAMRLTDPLIDLDSDVIEDEQDQITERQVECGCCFSEYEAEEMTQCGNQMSPHSFCINCARQYAKTEIGNGRALLKCMDQSGCTEPFPEREIRHFLDEKTYEAFDKLRTENELHGLVHCPFCDFAAIMDDPTDKIFECQNCEYQKEKAVDAKHVVEEAMTAAIVKKCNKCQRPFLKEYGCNKMACPCGNFQCYICSANVTGYTHFGASLGLCPLYDDTVERERKEVAVAQRQAMLNVLATRDDIAEDDLTVDHDLMAGIREQMEQQERGEKIRQVQLDEERLEQERQEGEQEAREILEEIEWEIQEEQEAIAAVREFERMEQLRLEEEARVAEERKRQQQLRKERQIEGTLRQLLGIEKDQKEWEDFLKRREVLHHSVEEEREVAKSMSAGEVEMYWARKIQNLQAFARDAKRFVLQTEDAFKKGKLTMDLGERYFQAKVLLRQAERELHRFNREAEIRRREAKRRQKAGILKGVGVDQAAYLNRGINILRKRR